MAQLPFEIELLHASAIGHAPNVCGFHDNARYPSKGRNVVNVGNGSIAVQSAPSGHATHCHAFWSRLVLFKYSPTLQKRHVDFDKKDPGSHWQSVGEVEPGGAVEEA